MATRLKVLNVFKSLHRTRRDVFKDDHRALTAARMKINDEFNKNKLETSEENIHKMIRMAADVEVVLRLSVLQMEHVEQEKLLLRPRDAHMLENVPYCEQPTRN